MIIDDHSVMDSGGRLVFIAALGINLIEWIAKIEFNAVLTGLMSIAGFIYIILKIQGQRLDNREKRKRLNEK